MKHDVKTFVKEYCKCRKIPYKFCGNTLYAITYEKNSDLDTVECTYLLVANVREFSYIDVIKQIDTSVSYDAYGTFSYIKRIYERKVED